MAIKVDYNEFPTAVSSLRTSSESLNSEITDAFKAIEECHTVWTGERYSDLAKKFSEIVEDVNKILDLVVGTIPFTLEQIYNNYYAADKQEDAKNATKNDAKHVSVNVPTGEILYIDAASVEPYNTRVKNAFDSAKQDMNTIESTVNGLTWESEAANNYRSELSSLKTSLSSSFDDIKSAFDTLSTQAVADFEAAERANNVAAQ